MGGRFAEVPPPLERRVTASVVARLRAAVGLGVALGGRVNATLNDDEVAERTTSAVLEALRPGRLPFALLLLLVALGALQWGAIQVRTARILRAHGHFGRDGDNGHAKHAHAE